MYSHNFLQEYWMPKYPDHIALIIALGCIACAIIGYLLGSINFSIIISKIFYKDDIRTHGSGNAGSTNMLRTHGTVSGLATQDFSAYSVISFRYSSNSREARE